MPKSKIGPTNVYRDRATHRRLQRVLRFLAAILNFKHAMRGLEANYEVWDVPQNLEILLDFRAVSEH